MRLRAWKVLRCAGDSLRSLYYQYGWHPGRNAVKGRIAPLAARLRRCHERSVGLHLFRTKAMAEGHIRFRWPAACARVVPVWVTKADFVAANGREVLARGVHLSKAAYDKALKATAPV